MSAELQTLEKRVSAALPDRSSLAFRHRLASQPFRLSIITGFYDQNGRVPSYREFMRLMGWTSTNAAFEVIQRMIGDGLIYKHPLPNGHFVLVPAGRKVSNKRGKLGVRSKELPPVEKRKPSQDNEWNAS